MKLKEFGCRGGGGVRPSRPPLDPPLRRSQCSSLISMCDYIISVMEMVELEQSFGCSVFKSKLINELLNWNCCGLSLFEESFECFVICIKIENLSFETCWESV